MVLRRHKFLVFNGAFGINSY